MHPSLSARLSGADRWGRCSPPHELRVALDARGNLLFGEPVTAVKAIVIEDEHDRSLNRRHALLAPLVITRQHRRASPRLTRSVRSSSAHPSHATTQDRAQTIPKVNMVVSPVCVVRHAPHRSAPDCRALADGNVLLVLVSCAKCRVLLFRLLLPYPLIVRRLTFRAQRVRGFLRVNLRRRWRAAFDCLRPACATAPPRWLQRWHVHRTAGKRRAGVLPVKLPFQLRALVRRGA